MLYFVTFAFFIAYIAFLSAGVWFLIRRYVAPLIGASRHEALIIFYCTLIIAFILLILINYYTGFLAGIYTFLDESFFGGRHTGG